MPARARAIPGPARAQGRLHVVAEAEPSGQREGGVWFALQQAGEPARYVSEQRGAGEYALLSQS
jgi:hypothetical protein